MSKVINIKGREISEDTIVAALKAHIGFEEQEEQYVFRPGDIVETPGRAKRIIVTMRGGPLISFDKYGTWASKGQDNFLVNGYKKIGELKDLLK